MADDWGTMENWDESGDGEPDTFTPAEIDALPAGPALDALVAERVMGWVCPPATSVLPVRMWVGPSGRVHPELPRFSTNIAAAWLVVERIGERVDDEQSLDFSWLTLVHTGDGYAASFDVSPHEVALDTISGNWWDNLQLLEYAGWAKTAPLAICRAALKAVLLS